MLVFDKKFKAVPGVARQVCRHGTAALSPPTSLNTCSGRRGQKGAVVDGEMMETRNRKIRASVWRSNRICTLLILWLKFLLTLTFDIDIDKFTAISKIQFSEIQLSTF